MARKAKIYLIAILLLLFVATLPFTFALYVRGENVAEGESQAFFLNEDRGAKGVWYTGENGLKENASSRIYGKQGAILLFHWAYENGQPYKNVADLNDFNDNSANVTPPYAKPHYTEYPSWIDAGNITADINGYGDAPHGYWNDKQNTIEQTAASVRNGQGGEKRLLPINPDAQNIMHTACLFTRDDVNFRMIVNDDRWHRVTAYVGSLYDHETGIYNTTKVSVCDTEGNVLSSYIVDDSNKGSYVSFAVKGSYILHVDTDGNFCASLNAIFFDEYSENAGLGTSGLSLSRQTAKEIDLSWQNSSEESVTGIYRKEVSEPDSQWKKIAETQPGVNRYTDADTSVGKEYEYCLSSGTVLHEKNDYYGFPTVSDTNWFNLPQAGDKKTIATADYRPSYIRSEQASYFGEKGDTFTFGVRLSREGTEGEEPFPQVRVCFKLDGDSLYNEVDAATEANVDVNIGDAVTDEQGYAQISWNAYFASEMYLVAYIEEQPDPEHPNDAGYDACSVRVSLNVSEPDDGSSPVLFSVTDEIRPNDTVTVTGNFLSPDDSFLVAYAPNAGCAAGEFDQENPPESVKYLTLSDMSVSDMYYETGIAFVFPAEERAGVYDLWVRNQYGWSNGLTINAARPLYLDQEAAYEGLPVQLVGRNLYLSSFGAGSGGSQPSDLKIKLVRVGDVAGADDGIRENYTLTVANGGIDVSLRYSSAESYTGENIYASNPYKVTFIIPQVRNCGTFAVYVSNFGENFVALEESQTLIIYERKAQNWDTAVFGSLTANDHIGNDPLDLRVYWAQDLNYTNVVTMQPNGVPTDVPQAGEKHAPSVIAMNNAIQNAINQVSASGGGVVYFPEGIYCFYQVELLENVMLVGAGTDKTVFLCDDVYGEFMVYATRYGKVNNLGVARVTVQDRNPAMSIAGRYFVWGEETKNRDEVPSRNVFMTDVVMDLDKQRVDGCGDALPMIITVNNIVLQNIHIDGGGNPYVTGYKYLRVENFYFKNSKGRGASAIFQALYSTIENCCIDMNRSDVKQNHGPSIRSDTYFAYNVVTGTGQRDVWSNDGEALLIEPAGTQPAHGKILFAEGRTFTVDYWGGSGKIDGDSGLLYNRFAITIIEGRGAGQTRYIDYDPVNAFGTEYRLQDGERDWDVLPDSSSVFVIDQLVKHITVLDNRFSDCKCGIVVYFCGNDVLVKDNQMTDAGGITVTSLSNGLGLSSKIYTTYRITIDGNTISGVAPKYNAGESEDMIGGIIVQICRSGDESVMLAQGLTIRGNHLYDLIPDVHCESQTKYRTGIIVYCNGFKNGSGVAGDGRYIVIENNEIRDSEWGIYCEDLVEGIVIRNNSISGLTLTDEPVQICNPTDLRLSAVQEIFVDGEKSGYSGEYSFQEILPALPDDDGRILVGYSLLENYRGGELITNALPQNAVLYAVFGYKVVLNLNYVKDDGSCAGEYGSFNAVGGGDVSAELESLGEPFRKGYDFVGWYSDIGCSHAFQAESGVSGNTVLYAKWDDGSEPLPEKGPDALLIWSVSGGGAIAAAAVIVTTFAIKKKKH